MRSLIHAALMAAALGGFAVATNVFAPECPVEGTAQTESGKALNILKNRASAPQADQVEGAAPLANAPQRRRSDPVR